MSTEPKSLTAMRYAKNKERAIWRLNLRITGCQLQNRHVGWIFFFSQSENTQQLKQLDAFIEKHAKKYLSASELEKIKNFVTAYHEIRYRLNKTSYFQNFDIFNAEQKKKQISMLLPKMTYEVLDGMHENELEDLFQKCLRHEVADLERDMMEVFS